MLNGYNILKDLLFPLPPSSSLLFQWFFPTIERMQDLI